MKPLVKIPLLLLSLSPLFMGCNTTTAHSKNAPLAIKKKPHTAGADSVTVEPQTTHIAYGDLSARTTRVVCYSYLDVEDYEEDTFSRGPLLQMMPGYSRAGWKYDPHPKVILTKKQIRRLLAILNTPKTYKQVKSTCYSPRNCFCFYDTKKEIIGYYEVCFENSRLVAVPGFKGSQSGTLSESGAKRLRNFCLSAGITAR